MNAGACVDNITRGGRCALHVACRLNKAELIDILLNNGANVNIQSNLGDTALTLVCKSSNPNIAIVRTLLEHGAKASLKNKSSECASYLARMNQLFQLARYIERFHFRYYEVSKQSLQCLDKTGYAHKSSLKRKMSVAIETNNIDYALSLVKDFGVSIDFEASASGDTVLMRSCRNGSVSNLPLILKLFRADPNYKNREGRTALMIASIHNHCHVMKYLLENKFSIHVDSQDNLGHTALMHASVSGHLSAVQILLFHGCDVEISSLTGLTSYQAARCNGYHSIATLIMQSCPRLFNISSKTCPMLSQHVDSSYLSKSKICQNCKFYFAQYHCVSCKIIFCASCWIRIHTWKKQHHIRRNISSSDESFKKGIQLNMQKKIESIKVMILLFKFLIQKHMFMKLLIFRKLGYTLSTCKTRRFH